MNEVGSPATPIRVLFVSHSAEWVGPTRSLFLLLKYLDPALTPAVVVPEPGPFAELSAELGVRVHTLPTLTKWSLPRLVRLIRREGIGLVYANNTHGSSRVAWAAARLAGVAFVTHVRGMAWGRSRIRMGYLGWADQIVAVSHACAESVRSFARSTPLEVVYNGVEPSGASLRIRRSEPADPVVLSLAHISARKGQLHAVEAFRSVHREFPQTRLILAGRHDRNPDYVQEVRDQIDRYGLKESVSMPGFCPDISPMLTKATILLHTALADPHPRAVIEAMSAALPVVAFATDGVAETVVDGVTGRLAPTGDTAVLADALADLLRDDSAARKMGEEGRKRVLEVFTARKAAQEVSRIIHEVVNERGRVR